LVYAHALNESKAIKIISALIQKQCYFLIQSTQMKDAIIISRKHTPILHR